MTLFLSAPWQRKNDEYSRSKHCVYSALKRLGSTAIQRQAAASVQNAIAILSDAAPIGAALAYTASDLINLDRAELASRIERGVLARCHLRHPFRVMSFHLSE
jgi:hypothetical protein